MALAETAVAAAAAGGWVLMYLGHVLVVVPEYVGQCEWSVLEVVPTLWTCVGELGSHRRLALLERLYGEGHKGLGHGEAVQLVYAGIRPACRCCCCWLRVFGVLLV